MFDWWAKIKRWLMAGKAVDYRDEIIDLVITCLVNDRASWAADRYHLTHKELGFKIWIANGKANLGINVDGGNSGPCNISAHSNSFTMTSAQKRRLWAAVQGEFSCNRSDYAEQIICRVMAFYERKQQPVKQHLEE